MVGKAVTGMGGLVASGFPGLLGLTGLPGLLGFGFFPARTTESRAKQRRRLRYPFMVRTDFLDCEHLVDVLNDLLPRHRWVASN